MKPKPKIISGLRPTKEKGTNPKDNYGILKMPYGAVSPVAETLLALCMGHGAAKYGYFNYRVSKVQALIYLEACRRHLNALLDGEDFDLKTGYPHVGFIMATAAVYADAWVNGFLIDNRPLPGKTGALINAFERVPGDPPHTPERIKELLLSVIHNSAASPADQGVGPRVRKARGKHGK
jgi:Domain of unknown function (DUF5664)